MYKTEQENFWAGEFGNDYIKRNKSVQLLANNLALFSEIIKSTRELNSIVEFGCNVGMNLKAFQLLRPKIECCGIEINEKAAEILKNEKVFGNKIQVYNETIFDIELPRQYDLSLIKGVLIHINPDMLDTVYEKLYSASRHYICIAEYYNPSPVTVSYRGNENCLFKRDFAGEFLNKYQDCVLVDYGFKYHADPNFSQDDITWFLIEKGRK